MEDMLYLKNVKNVNALIKGHKNGSVSAATTAITIKNVLWIISRPLDYQYSIRAQKVKEAACPCRGGNGGGYGCGQAVY
ncbi:MAG: hypothetical protein LBS82_05990 [Spirochaetaceae bacterium]|jgi:hypothetical protein|nr:hypothetical protein [Spirochaetaceae bacterium]